MRTVKLKIVEEGRVRTNYDFLEKLSNALLQEDIVVTIVSPLELKIKFTSDNGRELILMVLRNCYTKRKIKETIIYYKELTWAKDIVEAIPELLKSDVQPRSKRLRMSPVRMSYLRERVVI